MFELREQYGVQLIGLNKHEHKKSAWQFPHLVKGAIAVFLYVGAEVTIGSFMVNYLGMEKIAALPAKEAASP